jgi:hypothetical protein
MTLTAMRDEVTTALTEAGIKAAAFIPAQINEFPMALVGPGSPYIEPPDFKTFDGKNYKARLEVTLIVSQVVNDVTTKQLDELVLNALIAVCYEHDWTLENVGEPGVIQGANLFGCNITITNRLEVI